MILNMMNPRSILIVCKFDALKHITPYCRNRVSRWRNQPHHVEVWTEKKAMIRTFESILGYRQVLIVPFGGYTSITYHNDNCYRLKEFQDAGKEIPHSILW